MQNDTTTGQGAAPAAGLARREELGGTQLTRSAETSSTAAAALAKAEVEARFLVARAAPRDIDEVRVRLLRECMRAGFAEVARYRVPRGGGTITGPSIRFAEAALRLMGNIAVATPVLYEDDEKRIMRVTCTDLETNATYSLDVTITKTQERRELRKGAEVLGTRTTSTGQTVYIVKTTDDDLTTKQGAAVSKAIRTLVLRLVPGDIVEECMVQVEQTALGRAAADPEGERKRVIDGFAKLSVMPVQLAEYLGHDVAACSPAELAELRALWTAIRDGVTTMASALAERRETAHGTADVAATSRAAAVKDAVKRAAKPAPRTSPSQQAEEAASYDPSTGEVAPEDEPPLAG